MISEAPTCRGALTEASKRWPKRNKSSDGIMSSDAHKKQNPTSDHDRGNAFDLTDDPVNGTDVHKYSEWLAVKRDPRVKYIISNRRIWSAARGSEGWRQYSGSNPHAKHAHVSIYSTARASKLPWFNGYEPAKTPTAALKPDEDEMKSFIAIDATSKHQFVVAGDWSRKVWLKDGADPARLVHLGYDTVTLSTATLLGVPNAGI